MATISVIHEKADLYRVHVDEGASMSTHVVTVDDEALSRYAGGATPEVLLDASFQFLLAREPKESIMSAFALPVIERFFPEYPEEIGSFLAARSGGAGEDA